MKTEQEWVLKILVFYIKRKNLSISRLEKLILRLCNTKEKNIYLSCKYAAKGAEWNDKTN